MKAPGSINDIFVFMAVAEAGGFTAGGKVAGLTGSAAGKAVARLEERLGTRLFHRSTRAVSLTAEGEIFREGGFRILAAIEESEALVLAGKGVPRGTLRMTVPDAFGRIVVLPLVRRFQDEWPEVRVELAFSDQVADLVDEGFDLAVRLGGASANAGLVARTLAEYPLYLVASPDYVERRGTPADGDALATHECLPFRTGTETMSWTCTDALGEPRRLPVRSRLAMNSGEAIRDAVLAGQGIALLPGFLIADDLGTGRMLRVLPGLDLGNVPALALYPSRRLLEPRVRAFIDRMVEALASSAPTPPG